MSADVRSWPITGDPDASTATKFGELAAQFQAERLENAGANGIGRKFIEKLIAHVELIRELIGDETVVTKVDYDERMRVRKASS